MSKRMHVATPAVHEVLKEDRRVPEDEWGWMELGDIAEIASLPAWFILVRFFDFGTSPVNIRGRKTRLFHYRRTPCGIPDQFELRVLDTTYFEAGVCEDCRCNGELRELGLNRFAETHPIRVPARWGKEVLAELRKNPITLPK